MNSTIMAKPKVGPRDIMASAETSSSTKPSFPVETASPAKTVSFTLDTANGAPIYRQIIRQIEYAILSGRMRPGDRLPTIRSLAVELKTNPNTIARAYGELEIRGVLATQVGSGTYIADKKPVMEDDSLNRKIREVMGRFTQDMRGLGVEGRELLRLIESYIKEESK